MTVYPADAGVSLPPVIRGYIDNYWRRHHGDHEDYIIIEFITEDVIMNPIIICNVKIVSHNIEISFEFAVLADRIIREPRVSTVNRIRGYEARINDADSTLFHNLEEARVGRGGDSTIYGGVDPAMSVTGMVIGPTNFRQEFEGHFFREDGVTLTDNTFEMRTKDKEIREFEEWEGLFPKGIKKFAALPLDEQFAKIRELKEVFIFNEKKLTFNCDLKKYGQYHVILTNHARAMRIIGTKKHSDKNPFTSVDGGRICFGTSDQLYNQCWNNTNYLECVKIIMKVLSCEEDMHGYRRWTECGF